MKDKIAPVNKLIRNIAAAALDGVLELLCPRCCHVCESNLQEETAAGLCGSCLELVEFVNSPVCSCCGRMFEKGTSRENRFCGDCLKRPPPFTCARSLVIYKDPVATVVKRLKYRSETAAVNVLKDIVGGGFDPFDEVDIDYIVPVPLHISRMRQRGFNQAQVIAELLSAECRQKIRTGMLFRIKKTVQQAGLDGQERRKNLQNAFQLQESACVRNCSVMLVDDVYTTGATVTECAKLLKSAGASKVYVWTFARVPEYQGGG